jgi:hypothetical protein
MPHKTLTNEQWEARRNKRALIMVNTHCPECSAIAGARCYRNDRDGKRRKSPHIERIRLYYQQRKE